jgi:hypothetical protein
LEKKESPYFNRKKNTFDIFRHCMHQCGAILPSQQHNKFVTDTSESENGQTLKLYKNCVHGNGNTPRGRPT